MRARRSSSRLPRGLIGLATASALALGALIAGGAGAAEPTPAVTAFNAELCTGQTNHDPRTSGPDGYRDLTLVSGARLDAYNGGKLVPLYDQTGRAQADAVPPMCAVRHDAVSGGPVSEWMFCTDVNLNSCNDLLPGGRLAHKGTELTFPEEVAPRFDERQSHAIQALVAEGYTVADGRTGRADGTSAQRYTLQDMVWCVSDGEPLCMMAGLTEDDIDTLAARGADLEAALEVTPVAEQIAPGEVARWTVHTNVLGAPLSVQSDAQLTLCSSSTDIARLSAENTLVIDSATTSPATVELCATLPEEGDFEVQVNRAGEGTQFVQPGVPDGMKECQVYAFGHDPVVARATIAVGTADLPTDEPVEEATDEPSDTTAGETTDDPVEETTDDGSDETGDDEPTLDSKGEEATDVLPNAGAPVTAAGLGLAALLLVAGVALIVRRRTV